MQKEVQVVRPECVTSTKIAGHINQHCSRNQELPRKAIPPSCISDSFAEPPAVQTRQGGPHGEQLRDAPIPPGQGKTAAAVGRKE
jgi:hypothetical protein